MKQALLIASYLLPTVLGITLDEVGDSLNGNSFCYVYVTKITFTLPPSPGAVSQDPIQLSQSVSPGLSDTTPINTALQSGSFSGETSTQDGRPGDSLTSRYSSSYATNSYSDASNTQLCAETSAIQQNSLTTAIGPSTDQLGDGSTEANFLTSPEFSTTLSVAIPVESSISSIQSTSSEPQSIIPEGSLSDTLTSGNSQLSSSGNTSPVPPELSISIGASIETGPTGVFVPTTSNPSTTVPLTTSDSNLITSAPSSTSLGESISSSALPSSVVILSVQPRFGGVVRPKEPRVNPPSLGKRQDDANSGFVGDSDPNGASTCSDATLFRRSRGELRLRDRLISVNPGVPYINLLDIEEEGSITTTFSVVNDSLVWSHPSFYYGEAQFCQQTDGDLLVSFAEDGTPDDCVPVNLRVYRGKYFFRMYK